MFTTVSQLFSKAALQTALVIGLATGSSAAVVAINPGDFDGSETTIDFNSIADEVDITNQYAGLGVTFSGGLSGMDNGGDTSLFNGSNIASTWKYNGGGLQTLVWEAAFSSMQTMVGFWAETNTGDNVMIELFSGLTSLGSLAFNNANGLTIDFLGAGISTGFDRIKVTTENNYNGFFAMDDFRFSDQALAPVPLPASLPLLFGAFVLLGAVRKRKS
ncbi:MAG: VPLPA-CTERM sorting domain-containing protein [Rhodobacteraceae bacterium]|nr:VPLPA-CTERM sorting domain-containing protein [Paracoccaceae bacterium]